MVRDLAYLVLFLGNLVHLSRGRISDLHRTTTDQSAAARAGT